MLRYGAFLFDAGGLFPVKNAPVGIALAGKNAIL
jgi:hypothetical protein